jgi:hypothetical protein
MELTVVAYATLALSLFVSAVKMGGWILNADPRAIINSGRWALVALAALALGLLAWLVASGRWTSAMMLAAFMLPVFVQAAPRWRVLFGPLNATRSDFPPRAQDFGSAPVSFSTPCATTDPELVRQSIAVLRAYLEQAGSQIEHKPSDPRLASTAVLVEGDMPALPSNRGLTVKRAQELCAAICAPWAKLRRPCARVSCLCLRLSNWATSR